MTSVTVRERLRRELTARGCSPDGRTPHGSMVIAVDEFDVLDLLDIVIRRRENAYRDVEIVGQQSARECYEDAVLVIDAIKAVLAPLCERDD